MMDFFESRIKELETRIALNTFIMYAIQNKAIDKGSITAIELITIIFEETMRFYK